MLHIIHHYLPHIIYTGANRTIFHCIQPKHSIFHTLAANVTFNKRSANTPPHTLSLNAMFVNTTHHQCPLQGVDDAPNLVRQMLSAITYLHVSIEHCTPFPPAINLLNRSIRTSAVPIRTPATLSPASIAIATSRDCDIHASPYAIYYALRALAIRPHSPTFTNTSTAQTHTLTMPRLHTFTTHPTGARDPAHVPADEQLCLLRRRGPQAVRPG